MKRRAFLAGGLTLPLVLSGLSPRRVYSESNPAQYTVDEATESFVRDLQQRCYRYFLEAVDLKTQLVSDRAATDGSGHSEYASSAACGFGLAAHAVAAKYAWAPRGEIQKRVRTMLNSLLEKAAHERGLVYHFIDAKTGARALNSEASTIDTALMLAGALTASSAFGSDQEITKAADALYRRVDWNWMLGEDGCLHMGYLPEVGRLPHKWDQFSEHLILQLLAIGAPAHAIPPESWNAWRREAVLQFDGKEFLSYPPLFVHQYSQAFFPFQNFRSPSGRSYFENSVIAHEAQLAFQIGLARKFPKQFGHYNADLWGLTSSDSPNGYRDWGGPYRNDRIEPDRGIDGTVVPSAAGGALAIVPQQALRTLLFQKTHFSDQVYGRYGFTNAFNPASGWVGPDVIGIDTGITLLMAENLLTGGVWDLFMQQPGPMRGLQLAGFTPNGASLLTSMN